MHAPHDRPLRLTSIDAFRGIAIAMMILVNNQGDWAHVYPILRHAEWHGIGGADFVFPLFLFIMGTSLHFWHEAQRARGVSRRQMFLAAARRSLILIAIGLALNFFPACSIDRLRIPGVLQRIGICYAIAAAAVIYASLRAQAAAAHIITIAYGAILLWPHPAVSLEPCCTIPGMVDACLFRGHTYEHALAPGFDPEGLLSTIAASASVLMGAWAGRMAAWDRDPLRRALMPGCGFMLAAAGLALSLIIPLNKNLWTPSFLALTAGAAMILFFILHALCGIAGISAALLPFVAMGRNAIAVYILSTIAGKAMTGLHITVDGGSVSIKEALFRGFISPFFPPMTASLAYAGLFLAPWILTALIMYRKKCFVKI